MNNSAKNYLTLRDVWEIFIRNIWVFVFTLVLSMSVAVGYIIVTPPIYMQSASILIKSDDKGKTAIGSSAVFEQLGVVQTNVDINNEIFILATPSLMEEVVSRLALDYNYKVRYKGMRWVDVYGMSPFFVKVDDNLASANISFLLTLEDENSFKLQDLVVGGEVLGDLEGVFGEPLQSAEGSFTIISNLAEGTKVSDDLFSFYKMNTQRTAELYASALVVQLKDENASIIDLSISLHSKRKAADILNTLISVYNESWIKDKNRITLSTTNFINERLSIIEQELGAVDRNISSFKSENLLTNVEAVAGLNLQSSNEILKKQIDLNNQMSMAKYLLEHIQSDQSSSQLLPVNTGIESSAVNNQIVAYNELYIKKNELANINRTKS